MAKLCLGTVQFGMNYGINNKNGKPTKEKCFEMLDIAIENGIYNLDTAAVYGESEEIFGMYIKSRKLENRIEVVSKLNPEFIKDGENNYYRIVKDQTIKSLLRLNIECLDGYLIHAPKYSSNIKVKRFR